MFRDMADVETITLLQEQAELKAEHKYIKQTLEELKSTIKEMSTNIFEQLSLIREQLQIMRDTEREVKTLSSKDIEQDIKIGNMGKAIEDLKLWRSWLAGGMAVMILLSGAAFSLYTYLHP